MKVRWRFAVGAAVTLLTLPLAGCGNSLQDEPATPANLDGGASVFAGSCQSCHGEGAQGTDNGPPLVHEVYEPSHHGDAAFRVAINNGSPQHHWNFGDMRPVPGLDDQDIVDVTAYVRSLQRAAGIT